MRFSESRYLPVIEVPAAFLGLILACGSQVAAQLPSDIPSRQPTSQTEQAAFTQSQMEASGAEIAPISRAKAPFSPAVDRKANVLGERIDWMMLPSTYSHDAQGQRVDQYNSGESPTVVLRNDIQRSGYRHTRSSIQAGFTSDNYHSVEQWGDAVQPYGEWRYPFRPFSSPYSQWGPQLPQFMGGGGFGWMGGGGPNSMLPGPGNALGPLQDDYYPQAPILSAPGMNPWPVYPPSQGVWSPPLVPPQPGFPGGPPPAGNGNWGGWSGGQSYGSQYPGYPPGLLRHSGTPGNPTPPGNPHTHGLR